MSKRAFVPTPQQEAAISTPGDVLVRAGAGSGKTEVLAQRFVALIAGEIGARPPLMPEQIAAITFTEKATYDMRERIAGVLEQRLASETRANLQEHLRRAERRLALARISTIHAFCSRILRENPLAAGLDPDFEVIDEYESDTFISKFCEKALVEAVRAQDAGAMHLSAARRLRGIGFVEGALEVTVRIVRELRRRGHGPQWICDRAEKTVAAITAESGKVVRLAHELCQAVDDLCAIRPAQRDDKLAELRIRWPQMRRRIWAFNAASPTTSIGLLRELRFLLPDAKKKELRDPVKRIRAIFDLSSDSRLAGELTLEWGAQKAVGPMRDVAALMARIAAAVDEACRVERVVTFDDLLVKTRDVLGQEEVTERYRRQLRVLLVDEYQDTDPVQDEVVRLLTTRRDGADVPELFIVGDEKQSIYRFRGADVAVFNHAQETAPQPLPLSENRRSTHSILNFVNELGSHIMPAAEGEKPGFRVEWSASHRLTPLRDSSFSPAVEYFPAIGGDANVAAKRELEARALARRINEFIEQRHTVKDAASDRERTARWGDIVILLRAFTDVAIYERVLTEAGIDLYTVKGRGFYGCPEVLDLIELLTAVNDARDSLALAAALRSPFFALSDKTLFEMAFYLRERRGEAGAPATLADLFARPVPDFDWLEEGRNEAERAWRVLNELRSKCLRLPIFEVVEHALALTDFEAVMLGLAQGRQRVANLRKLIEISRSFDAHRFFSFHDFISYLLQLTAAAPLEPQAQVLGENENVVRLMTVHQAKGLEFPIVIVADAGRREGRDRLIPALDPEHGLLLCATEGSGHFEIPNRWVQRRRERVQEEENAESGRLLYVALTRARDYLVVSEGAGTNGWAEQMRELLGEAEIEDFMASTAESRPITRGKARMVLRRPITGPMQPCALPSAQLDGAGDTLAALARRRVKFTAEAASELVVSPTLLADFARCPRQFHLRHHLGLAEAPAAGSGDGDGAALMGTVAHVVLERLDLTVEARALGREIRELTERLGGASGLDAAQRAAITNDLSRYVTARARDRGRVEREVPFFLSLDGSIFVRGQIDVLIEDAGSVLVRDYKYARSADEAHIYLVQMECYALAAAEAYPGRHLAAEIIFLRDRTESVAIALPSADEIRSKLRALGTRIVEARQRGEYPKQPSSAAECRALHCGYIGRCWGN